MTFCLQTYNLYKILKEPVYHQLQDLEALIGDEYEWVGAGRNDGDKQGEFSAIFYKR